jgi:ribosomal protein S18 acetylase RimI-like enzyme
VAGNDVIAERLDGARAAEATGVLTRAFEDNPATLAIFAGYAPDELRRGLGRAIAAFVDISWRHGTSEVLLRAGRVIGVALTFGPGAYPPPLGAQLRMAARVAGSGLRSALGYARAGEHMQRLHPKDPHWYLFFLGVEPELQGQGLGGQLLERLNERADRDQVIGYLETDRESNLRLYQRYGFQILTDDLLPRVRDLRLWTMRRPVGAGAPTKNKTGG